MDWIQVLLIISANLVMFFWLRTESVEANIDRRQDSQDIREILQILKEMNDEMKHFNENLEIQNTVLKICLRYDHVKAE